MRAWHSKSLKPSSLSRRLARPKGETKNLLATDNTEAHGWESVISVTIRGQMFSLASGNLTLETALLMRKLLTFALLLFASLSAVAQKAPAEAELKNLLNDFLAA